jgi:hypothetical protein
MKYFFCSGGEPINFLMNKCRCDDTSYPVIRQNHEGCNSEARFQISTATKVCLGKARARLAKSFVL